MYSLKGILGKQSLLPWKRNASWSMKCGCVADFPSVRSTTLGPKSLSQCTVILPLQIPPRQLTILYFKPLICVWGQKKTVDVYLHIVHVGHWASLGNWYVLKSHSLWTIQTYNWLKSDASASRFIWAHRIPNHTLNVALAHHWVFC